MFEGDEVGKRRYVVYRASMYILTIIILVISINKFNVFSPVELTMLSGSLVVGVVMGNMRIEASNGNIDLSDAIIAFVFIYFGREVATVYDAFFWVLVQAINKLILNSKKDLSKITFNVSMFTIITYISSTIINVTLANVNLEHPLSRISLMDIGSTIEIIIIMIVFIAFIGIHLIMNIIFFKLDYRIETGRRIKFDRDSIMLLYMNFGLSSLLGITMYLIEKISGMVGFILILGLLLLCHYGIYMTRKLEIRNEAIKGLLKITVDVVKYGEFRDKCIKLIENLKGLIPYNLCAFYTFDVENDSISYPIAYSGPEGIHIGDLGFDLSSTGITIKVVMQGRTYISRDIKHDKNIRIEGGLGDSCDAMVFVPVLIQDRVVGIILIGGNRELINFMRNGIDDMLTILSNQMALAIENNGIYKEIENKAYIDNLTGLYNRHVFDREIAGLLKNDIPFSMVIYDIDNFKRVNDTYGHLAGDRVIKEISHIIKTSIRKTDIPCRYGGEEIVVIFKDLSKADAYIISERIRELIEKAALEYEEIRINVTVSGGVSAYPDDGCSKEDIVKVADNELYLQCKRKGKNRVSASNLYT